MAEQCFRLFISSPGDAGAERLRVEAVTRRLNTEFEGVARFEPIRWETKHYSAHDTFQNQILEAAACDLVVAIFRARLGSALPSEFRKLPSGDSYPSGSAYEVLSAIEARKAGKDVPDIYVFRFPKPPSIQLDDPAEAEIRGQWERLKAFFDAWFKAPSGPFVAAFQEFTSTDDFETRVEECLRQWLGGRGVICTGPVWDRALQGSPFRGLEPFEARHRLVFFGRDRAIEGGLKRLKDAASRGALFLLVIGASGSGKSSLLRAGLVPGLVQPGAVPEIDLWRQALVVPGADPLHALAEALFADVALGPELRLGDFPTVESLARQLAGDPEIAVAPIRSALEKAAAQRAAELGHEAPRKACLALAIDQVERLFTEPEPEAAAAFAKATEALVSQGLATVMAALRSDAYGRFQAVPAFLALREAGATLDLLPPSQAELEDIVAKPVAACQPPLTFEVEDGRSLAEVLAADAKGGDALALLQITLQHLFEAEAKRGDGVLHFSDYPGLAAAVTETAKAAFATLDDAARADVPALLNAMVSDVTSDPVTGEPVLMVQPVDRATFESRSSARKALVDAFVAARLLTTESSGDRVEEKVQVRPVHDALLRIWPEGRSIIGENASLIRVRHALGPIVREWAGAAPAEKRRHLEISPALLDGAKDMVGRFGDDVPSDMRAFVKDAIAADKARRRKTVGALTSGLVIALGLAALAVWQWQAAVTQRNRAERAVTVATETANGLVFDLAQKFRDVSGVPAATIKDILDRARKLLEELAGGGETNAELRRIRAAALHQTAKTLLTLGDTSGTLAAATQSRDISRYLAALDPNNTGWQRDLSVSYDTIGDVQVAQGDLAGALTSYRDSLAIADRLANLDPGNAVWQRDLSVSYDTIGDVQVAQGDLKAALKSYRESLTIRDRLVKSDPGYTNWQRDLSVSYGKIGYVQEEQGDLSGALKSYRDGLAIRDRLATSDPSNAKWQRDLSVSYNEIGDVLKAQGDLKAALTSYRDSLAIADRLAKSDPGNVEWQRDLMSSYSSIGDVQVTQGDLEAALTSYRDSLVISDRLTKSDPGNTNGQRDLMSSYIRIGDVQKTQGDLEAALKSYSDGLAITDRLAKADPGNAGWQRDLSVSFAKVGDVQVAQGDLKAAMTSYRNSRDILDRLAKSDPSNAEWQRDLSVMNVSLGNIYVAQKNLPAALEQYRASLDRMVPIRDRDPSNAELQRFTSLTLGLIGDVEATQGNLAAALKSYQDSLVIAKALAAKDQTNALWRNDLTDSITRISNLAYRFVMARNYAKGLAAADEAIALAPDMIGRYINRAHALMFLGRLDEAQAVYFAHRGKVIQGDKVWEKVVLDDFAELRKVGLTHPLMDKITKAFAKPK